ncbi:hypothetical protein [Microscilla marina]|uniref:Uncharacterized protein n=1 Tax=Microscilla marina ATCC 23134 TaxID=313606 RepID=A1ZZ15_MICM2|nr:hypothetical protein [Microscilla marina]EAY24395.1 hypothetical protein M23134_07190 [Microscilla marina ATCC 23134]
MSLDKIDFLHHKDNPKYFGANQYKAFAEKLLKHVKHTKDFVIITDWKDIRENSLIITYAHKHLHDELANLPQQNTLEFYRRIFVINWSNTLPETPRGYQNKAFAGHLISLSYQIIMDERKALIQYADFFGDSAALNNLKAGAKNTKQQWGVQTIREAGLYEAVHCAVNVLKVLSMYLDEYMEKYDWLKKLDPCATNHARTQQSAIDILDEHSLEVGKSSSFALKILGLASYVLAKGGVSNLSDDDDDEILMHHTPEEIALCIAQYHEDLWSHIPLEEKLYLDQEASLVKLMAYAYNINKNLTLSEYPEYIAKMKERIKTPEDLKEIKRDYPKIYSFMAQKAYKLGRVLEKDLLGG